VTENFSRGLSQRRSPRNCSFDISAMDAIQMKQWDHLRESMAISCTVVIVPPSSGTLTFRRLDSEPLRCQKGTLSAGTAVSLSEVGERPIDRADSLSEDNVGLTSPTGLLDDGTGHNWYLDEPDNCRLTREGLFSEGPTMVSFESLDAWRFLSDLDRRGR
jgi:hypothetical protein